jgi:hypothetical protein
MAEINQSFGDQLVILAKIVELLETSFMNGDIKEIELKIDEQKLDYIRKNLNYPIENKLIINIGNVDFIFSKK